MSRVLYRQNLITATVLVSFGLRTCNVGPEWEPCVETEEANRRFQACCSSAALDPACVDLCRYDIPMTTLGRALSSGAGNCTLEALAPIVKCAGEDAGECCVDKNVFEGTGDLCTPFCSPKQLTSLGPQQLRCAERVETILRCHQATLEPEEEELEPETELTKPRLLSENELDEILRRRHKMLKDAKWRQRKRATERFFEARGSRGKGTGRWGPAYHDARNRARRGPSRPSAVLIRKRPGLRVLRFRKPRGRRNNLW